jgi:phosphorylase kinase alpha/beta subunit
LIGHAVRLSWLERNPHLSDHYPEYKGVAWRSFYETSPYDCASYIVKALRFLMELGQSETETETETETVKPVSRLPRS